MKQNFTSQQQLTIRMLFLLLMGLTLAYPNYAFSNNNTCETEILIIGDIETTPTAFFRPAEVDQESSYIWEITDGGYWQGAAYTHTFDSIGTFEVKLTRTTSNGDVCEATLPVTISSLCHTSIDIALDETNDFRYIFSAEEEDSESTYEWTVSNGVTAQGVVFDYTFPTSGEYSVRLTRYDANQDVCEAVRNLFVSGENTDPSCEFFPETFGTELLIFTDVPLLYDWYFIDFGDNTVTDTIYVEVDGPTTLHNSNDYAETGEYRVCLTTQSEGNICSSCQTVSIETENPDECNADFSVIENPRNPLEYAFFARQYSEGLEYEWTLNEEFISADSAFSHVFDDSGLYELSLTIYNLNQESCTSSKTLEVALEQTECTVEYENLSDSTIIIYPHLTNTDSAYSIDFGDGTIVNEMVSEDTAIPSVSHTYTRSGHYLVLYKVYSEGGGTCEKVLEISIDLEEPFLCDFYVETQGKDMVLYTEVPQVYSWYYADYGDGTVTDTVFVNEDGPITIQLAHSYTDPGVYRVCLNKASSAFGVICEECQEVAIEQANNPDSLYIVGSLFADLIPVEGGMVELYRKEEQDWLKVDETDTEQGYFKFEDLEKGEYLMHARGNEDIHFAFIPTYFVNGISWRDAYHLELENSAVDVKITLIRAEALNLEGDGRLQGRIANAAEDLQPTVILLQDLISKRVLQWTVSDHDHGFEFDELPFGRYQITMEKPGDSFVKAFELTENTPEILDFEMNPGVVSSTEEELSGVLLKVFPTRVQQQLQIQNTSYRNESLRVEILSTTGKRVLLNQIELGAAEQKPLDLAGIQSGLFFIRIQDESGRVMIKRLIKE